MAGMLISVAIGAVVSAATSTLSAIAKVNQARVTRDYTKALVQSQADANKAIAKAESDEIVRKAKFTFGAQRATGAAMGLGFQGSSVEDIQQMDIGLATLDAQKKLFEGELSQWQADAQKQMADYQFEVTKSSAWQQVGLATLTGAAKGLTQGIGSASQALTMIP